MTHQEAKNVAALIAVAKARATTDEPLVEAAASLLTAAIAALRAYAQDRDPAPILGSIVEGAWRQLSLSEAKSLCGVLDVRH